MLRQEAAYAREIIDYYNGNGVECWVVDEHSSLLVSLSSGASTHEFRLPERELVRHGGKKGFYRTLEKELRNFKTE